ncbi:hypothetical protein IV494_00240 [Kaistella sp. G5-32]|uniref:S9 family peptidase n=1 Tax=Kaistella gelatinilytica TaxID=2787636 RepID=A0ABS0F7D9_9FLAO|nr:hypothetical protein [Kaistella gelatinilytica]MBF8455596.1 hypothetical protein [Kaistella gelatinilytica]
MKKLLVLVLLVSLQQTAFGQKSKLKQKTPPPKISKVEDIPPPIREIKQTIYEKLFDSSEHPPLAFEWRLDADTLLAKGGIYRKHLEIGSDSGRLNKYEASNDFQIRKDYAYDPLKQTYKLIFLDIKFDKNIIITTDKKTGNVVKYKIFLNKAQTKVTKLENLKTKQIYSTGEFEGPTISM